MSEHMLWETIDEQKQKIADLEQDLEHKKIAIQNRNAKIAELEAQIEKMKCCVVGHCEGCERLPELYMELENENKEM